MIIGESEVARDRPRRDLSEVHRESQHRPRSTPAAGTIGKVVGIGQLSRTGERRAALLWAGDGFGDALRLVGGQVEVSPIDAQVVSAFGQNRLLARAPPQYRLTVHLEARGPDRLFGGVHYQVGRRVEIDGRLVLFAVDRTERPLDVSQGPREDLQIVR